MISAVVFVYGFRRRRKHLFMVSVLGFVMVSVVAGKHFVYGFRRWFLCGFRRGKERFVYGFRR